MTVPSLLPMAVTVFVLAFLPAASRADSELRIEKKKPARLDGNWELVSSVNEGTKADVTKIEPFVMVVEAGRMASVSRTGVSYGTFKWLPEDDAHPARVDWKYGDSPAKTGTSLCIYKVEDDTLTLSMGRINPSNGQGDYRPKDFDESKPGSGVILLVYKRVKPELDLKNYPFPADLITPDADDAP